MVDGLEHGGRGRVAIMIVAIALAASLLAATATAQPSVAKEQRATELFRRGREAMHAKDYETACASFAESQRLLAARGTLLNLAVCLEARGRIAEALSDYRQVLSELPRKDERRAFTQKKVDALLPRVPKLTLELSPELPPETSVARDGVGIASADLSAPLLVEPGEHIIEVRVPGHEDRRYHVSLAEGDAQKLLLEAGPPEGMMETDVPDAAPAGKISPLLIGGIAVGAVGVVGIVIGAVTGGLAAQKKSVVEANCGPNTCSNQKGLDAVDSGSTLASVSTATVVIGGAAAATGLVLVLVGMHDGGEGDVALAPVFSPAGASMAISGRF